MSTTNSLSASLQEWQSAQKGNTSRIVGVVSIMLWTTLVFTPVVMGAPDTSIGIAAGSETVGSTITVGLPPAQVEALVVTFTQQLGVAAEARTKAEAQAAELAAQLGFTQNAVISFLRILGEQAVPLEQMPSRLGEIAQRYQELQARLHTTSSTDPDVQRLKEQARSALDVGDFAEAGELLNQAKARDLTAIEQMQASLAGLQAELDARKLSAAEAAAQNGDLMMTQIRYAEAANYFSTGAELLPTSKSELGLTYSSKAAEALYRQGYLREDEHALTNSIELYRSILDKRSSKQNTSQPVHDQYMFGTALAVLGERKGGTNLLAEAVDVLQRALQMQMQGGKPLERAHIQYVLGSTFLLMGEREGNDLLLETAAHVLSDALQGQSREREPLAWADTQNRLAVALNTLGEHRGEMHLIKEALDRTRQAQDAIAAFVQGTHVMLFGAP